MIYTFIAIVMTVIFVIAEGVVSSQAIVRLDLPTETGALIAASLTALFFLPIRSRIERTATGLVDRFLPPSTLSTDALYEAVIVCSDLDAASASDESDHDSALAIASQFHEQAEQAAKRHRGRVVRRLGDTVLFEYQSVADAITAAIWLQKSLRAACQDMLSRPVAIQTCIHKGLVVRASDSEIYGGSVNIALRLQSVAGPNEIVLSGTAATALHEGSDYSLEAIGNKRLRNAPQPVPCYRLASPTRVVAS